MDCTREIDIWLSISLVDMLPPRDTVREIAKFFVLLVSEKIGAMLMGTGSVC